MTPVRLQQLVKCCGFSRSRGSLRSAWGVLRRNDLIINDTAISYELTCKIKRQGCTVAKRLAC